MLHYDFTADLFDIHDSIIDNVSISPYFITVLYLIFPGVSRVAMRSNPAAALAPPCRFSFVSPYRKNPVIFSEIFVKAALLNSYAPVRGRQFF